jgi:hypothetical protein
MAKKGESEKQRRVLHALLRTLLEVLRIWFHSSEVVQFRFKSVDL